MQIHGHPGPRAMVVCARSDVLRCHGHLHVNSYGTELCVFLVGLRRRQLSAYADQVVPLLSPCSPHGKAAPGMGGLEIVAYLIRAILNITPLTYL